MERIFQISAVILAGVAAYFFWRGNTENSFVAGVLAAVSFFLSVRFQVRDRMAQRAAENREEEEIEEISDELRLNEMPAAEQLDRDHLTTNDEQKI